MAGQKADTTSERERGVSGCVRTCLCLSGPSELKAIEAMIWQVHIVKAHWLLCGVADWLWGLCKNTIQRCTQHSCSRMLSSNLYSTSELKLTKIQYSLCPYGGPSWLWIILVVGRGWNNTKEVMCVPSIVIRKNKVKPHEEWIMQDFMVPLTKHILYFESKNICWIWNSFEQFTAANEVYLLPARQPGLCLHIKVLVIRLVTFCHSLSCGQFEIWLSGNKNSVHPSIHPSIFHHLSGLGVVGAAAWAGKPRLPSPQPLHPSLPGGSRGVPRPPERPSLSSVS